MTSTARQEHIGRLLVAATRRFDEDLVAQLRARGFAGVRPAHAAVFANLDAAGTRPSELARRAGMTKQSMGELIADLEAKGYVVRRDDARDRRAKVVVLTEAGRKLDREATRAIRELERAYRGRLGSERFETVRGALAELGSP